MYLYFPDTPRDWLKQGQTDGEIDKHDKAESLLLPTDARNVKKRRVIKTF